MFQTECGYLNEEYIHLIIYGFITAPFSFNITLSLCKCRGFFHRPLPFKEWVSFFLGSWEMNRSEEQTNRVNREAVLVRFVCSALRFISHEPRKKDTHSLYLQCLQQRPLIKFSEQSKKFKFPAKIGHLTLFPDKTILAYSFRQNSAGSCRRFCRLVIDNLIKTKAWLVY